MLLSTSKRAGLPKPYAWVAELVDAKDLKSFEGFLRTGSTPVPGTLYFLDGFIE